MNQWIVRVDTVRPDSGVLANVIALANKCLPKSIHFIYVGESADLPVEIAIHFPDLKQTELSQVEASLYKRITEELDKQIDFAVTVKLGNSLTELLKITEKSEVDLLLIGNDKAHAKANKKIIRKAPCSVLLVPEKFKTNIGSIFMPIDYSDYTDMSVNMALKLGACYPISEVKAVNYYFEAAHYLNQIIESPFELPNLIQQQSVLDEKLINYARQKAKEFEEKNEQLPNLTVKAQAMPKGSDIMAFLEKDMKTNSPDFVIMGSKGKTASSTSLLGTVTDNLNAELNDCYLVILKKEGENLNFLRSLLKKSSLSLM